MRIKLMWSDTTQGNLCRLFADIRNSTQVCYGVELTDA